MLPVSAPPIRDGAVLVDDGRIAFVGVREGLLALIGDPDPRAGPLDRDTGDGTAAHGDVEIVALGASILMPGLVNAHSHLELTALRGFLEGLEFREWLRALTAVRNELLSAADLLDSARSGIREGLRNGITMYADTAASVAPLDAMREAKVRGIGYVETFGPHPDQRDDAIAALQTIVRAERARDGALVHTGISPHAPYTVSAPLFEAVAALAREEALPVAVHVAESEAETRFVRDGAGPFADALRARGIPVAPQARSPIALLERTGVLAARPLLVHAIHVDEADRAAIAAHGASVVHCPISNLKLGQGVARIDRLRHAGIAVGLGTDSVASNDRMDLLSEARQAALLQSLAHGVPDALSAFDALRLATIGGAAALGADAVTGTLDVGKRADLVAFPLQDEIARVVYDPAVTLVHVLAGRVTASLVTVDGHVLLRHGTVAADDPALDGRMRALGERLHEWRMASPSRHPSLRWRTR